jgi:2-hydroxychromene-2-carboxylate isomerase
MADVEFFWDPVCPFAWVTSRWVVKVAAQRDYDVDWRFISLRLVNKDRDYGTELPEGYPDAHTQGLRLLRVAAAVRADVGREPMGALYTRFGQQIWDRRPEDVDGRLGAIADLAITGVPAILAELGLPGRLAAALDDDSWDELLQAETDEALGRTGDDVGTPILTFEPPDGVSFFGPVISSVPSDEEALRLWDAVLELARWPGFAELKRSLRQMPQLPLMGADS